MSGRRAASNANRIRGPQSALTDFLAANNISAQQIRDSYEQRRQRAEHVNTTTSSTPDAATTPVADPDAEDDNAASLPNGTPMQESSRKRKRAGDKKKEMTKGTKKMKKGKGKGKGSDDDSDGEYDEEFAIDRYQKAKPLPGQLENCEICGKRFTVTAYSKNGPDGGLVCTPCGRELAKDDGITKPKARKAAVGKGRRKVESNRLDGILSHGPKSLQQLCVEKVADQHNDIEEFGDLPDSVLDRLSEIFAKRRVLDSRTFSLFLRPDLETVAIHDCAKLQTEDYMQICAVAPNVRTIILRNASQLKDSVIRYMMEKATNLTNLQLHSANLVTNETWMDFFIQCGPQLQTLKLSWLDASLDDEAIECLATNCTNLRRLKLKYCRQVTSASLLHLARLQNLQHLSIRFSTPPEPAVVIPLILTLGPNLETLSLENFTDADDTVIEAIRTTCGVLSKLRLTDVDCVTDAALAALFSTDQYIEGTEPNTGMGTRLPPLSFLDLSNSRDIDPLNPLGPEDSPIGLASSAFTALFIHSGPRLRTLRIPSCRHISEGALCDVFSPATGMRYPELTEMDMSFVNSVNTPVMNGIFKTCPALKKLVAFGCFKVEDVVVPRGLVMVGLPRAQDVIEQVGDGVGDTIAGGTGKHGEDGTGVWAAADEMMEDLARVRAVEVGA